MSDKLESYAEMKGEKRIDWPNVLEMEPEAISPEYMEELCDDALAWPRCACGQMCSLIERNPLTGEPYDEKLSALGAEFYGIMATLQREHQRGEFDDALTTMAMAKDVYNLIEARSAEILEEMGAKLRAKRCPSSKA